MMNQEGCGRKERLPDLKTFPDTCLDVSERTKTFSGRFLNRVCQKYRTEALNACQFARLIALETQNLFQCSVSVTKADDKTYLNKPRCNSRSHRGKRYFFSPICTDQLWGPPSLLFSGYQCSFRRYSDWGVTLTSHLHLVPRLRMSGAIHLLHLCGFMAWVRRTLLYSLKMQKLGRNVFMSHLKNGSPCVCLVAPFALARMP